MNFLLGTRSVHKLFGRAKRKVLLLEKRKLDLLTFFILQVDRDLIGDLREWASKVDRPDVLLKLADTIETMLDDPSWRNAINLEEVEQVYRGLAAR